MPRTTLAVAFAALLLVSAVPPAFAQTATGLPPLGMSVASIAPLKAAGAAPKYGSYWVGDWMATSGWGGFDNAMKTAKAEGVTPVLYWYYWGDSISPSCFDADGCNGRNEAEWNALTDQLVAHLKSTLGGAEALVVLENEFNKGGITGDFAPTFDAKLDGIAEKLDAVAGVKLVLGFGAWGEASWEKFPRSAAQSDYIGFQMMRASTRDSEASYRAAADRSAYLTNFIASKFNKPSFLYDLALSSYPDATWEKIQAETLDAIFSKLVGAGNTGLQGVVYRSLNDNYMDPANYYGYAESHWGLRTRDGTPKPAFDVWLEHAKGGTVTPPPPPAENVPGSFEAEKMPATKGGYRTDAAASGGAAWNLWANGELTQTLVANGSQKVRITIVAMGQAAGGVDPRMEIRVGATTLLATMVPTGAYRSFSVDASLPDGSSTLAIVFTNDAIIGSEDRNLIVDVAKVGAVPANQPPVAAFSSSADGLTASFDASASRDPEGSALTYAWSFGDGATAGGARVSHTYAEAGTYRVSLVVSDGQASATASSDVDVARPNAAPVASFSALVDGLLAKVDASASTDPDGDALSYSWSFGDGGSASGAIAQHTYAESGSYVITLVASDGSLSSTTSKTVTVVRPNAAPVAAFTPSAQHLAASFDASASSDADGDALTYAWSFGDGTTGTGAKAAHEYAAPGTYTVSLTVSDGKTGATRSQSLTVTYPAPIAKATMTGAGTTRTFDGSGSSDPAGGALTYAWRFSDGGSATGVTATRTFEPGDHTATLTVTNRFGKSATATVTVSIAAPQPQPEPQPQPVEYMATFTPVNGNGYWVQVRVDANDKTTAVCVTVDGGSCKPLQLKSWGDWANSMKVSPKSRVTYTATSATGQKVTSATYHGSSAKLASEPLSVTFTPYDGNNYWVQTKVDANKNVASVCAIVDGAACAPLSYRSWGAWATSFYVATGAQVKFVVTATTGEKAISPAYTWPVD